MSTSLKEAGLELNADVLIIGGGPAAAWAAWGAATNGAKTILVDKGYCGTSGATAPSGTGVWVIPPVKEARDKAKAEREALGGYLASHEWMDRVLDQTWENINLVEQWGYPFTRDENGNLIRRGVQGPQYMRVMRKVVKKAGVQILDQSPALELLVDENGAVAGARGIQRQENRPWTIRAGAVVIATGGCAWLSKALGCNTNTGDGYLFAAEVGGDLSGMEFSNHYAISSVINGSVTKGVPFGWASMYDESGNEIGGFRHGRRSTSHLAKTLLKGPVYATIDHANEEVQAILRSAQPNFFLPYSKAGIDPFKDRFPITLVLEGTVRGTAGIRLVDESCAASVPGLYAAGDAATRELICGGFTGGGSHNAAWAICSGHWAGQGAAKHAKSLGEHAHQRQVRGAGRVGLLSSRETDKVYHNDEVLKGVQDELFPYDKNMLKTESSLLNSLAKLNGLWNEIQANPDVATPRNRLRSREIAALVTTARWSYFSGLERKETRGEHRRLDYPSIDPNQHHYLISGGFDKVWVRPEKAPVSPALVAKKKEAEVAV